MSDRAAWWPPKAGDRLREVSGPDESRLLHVVATFEHDDRVRVVTARWNIHRHQWESVRSLRLTRIIAPR